MMSSATPEHEPWCSGCLPCVECGGTCKTCTCDTATATILPLPERRDPTHVLVVEVPLFLEEGDPLPPIDPVSETVKLVIGLSRAFYRGYISDDIQVSITTP